MAVVYRPTLDFKNKFHKDHIFPKRLFTRAALRKQGIPESKFEFYQENHNTLANLQLLSGIENQEKSGKPFEDWLDTTKTRSGDYMKTHFIPTGISLSLDNFEEFIEERKKLLATEFSKYLKMPDSEIS